MLSEGTNWSGAMLHLIPTLADSQARGLLGAMASHSYNGPNELEARRDFAKASARNGLPVWMSEMSLMQPPQPDDPGMTAALAIADYIHRDVTDAHASAWIYCFAIFRSAFPGSMGVLSPSDSRRAEGALVVPKRLWAIANYSRFVRPGWKLMDVDSSSFDNTGFISPDGGNFVIVAVNRGGAQAANYDFGGHTIGAVRAFVTKNDADLNEAAPPAAESHRFSATLAPSSVTTFVGTLAQ
jgi:O-glycosyl hydrolase